MLATLSADDIRILQLLQHDAKLTNKEIADKLGKTVTPIYERIRKLETEGYIKKYVAILDKRLIEKTLVAFTNVQLKEHSQVILSNFSQEVIKLSEVMECYHMTGQFDFLLKISVRDMDEYQVFLLNKLSTLANIGVVQTFFVLSESKHETAYSLKLPAAKKTR